MPTRTLSFSSKVQLRFFQDNRIFYLPTSPSLGTRHTGERPSAEKTHPSTSAGINSLQLLPPTRREQSSKGERGRKLDKERYAYIFRTGHLILISSVSISPNPLLYLHPPPATRPNLHCVTSRAFSRLIDGP